MSPQPDSQATQLLLAAAGGDRSAADRLLPLVYDQLRAAAQGALRHEAASPSLQATQLVHDAYLKLIGPRNISWQNRAHFYAAAAQAIRQILIDHARARQRRGPKAPLTELESVADLVNADSEQIVAVDAAVGRLEGEDPQAAAVVRLRFYAGLSVEQAAEAMGISPRTAARLWTYARAVLFDSLRSPESREGHSHG